MSTPLSAHPAPLTVVDAPTVHRLLDYPGCIAAMEQAMRTLSAGTTRQLPRTMIGMGAERTFAQMSGSLADDGVFGSKLISVFADPANPGQRRHRGLITLFAPEDGAPLAVVDAEAVTHIRTAAATAVATRALARRDAEVLLVMGTGGQAHTHLAALPLVHDFRRVLVWGRDPARARAVVDAWADQLPVEPAGDAAAAVAQADVICTVSGSPTPILLGAQVRPGTHVNLVGSSAPGPVEVDSALVARGRYIADSVENARLAAAEWLVARAEGAVGEDHLAGEIGQVLLGRIEGRRDAQEITLYKSLGHVVQDLAAANLVLARLRAQVD